MSSKLRICLGVTLLIGAMASVAMGQGALQKTIKYTINTPYALKGGDYMLPPGHYVLYQVSATDLNLFGLYQNDLRHGPIAMIRTLRINYAGTQYPEHTRMLIDMHESGTESYPVLRGWTIPGESGWEIIGVVAKNTQVMARVK